LKSRKERKSKIEEKSKSMVTRKGKRRTSTVMDLTKRRKNHLILGLKGWSCPRLKGMTHKVG